MRVRVLVETNYNERERKSFYLIQFIVITKKVTMTKRGF